MKWMRYSIVIVAVALIALGAGFVSGSRSHATSTSGDASSAIGDEALVSQLGLTPQQRDQMRTIWQGVQSQVQASYQSAQDLQNERDQELIAILTDEQKAAFESISREYAAKFKAVSQQRDEAFQAAVEQTNLLLDETQRRKYAEILDNRLGQEF